MKREGIKLVCFLLAFLIFAPTTLTYARQMETNVKPNALPKAYIDYVSPSTAVKGEKIYFKGHGEDKDGYIVSCTWTSNLMDKPLNITKGSESSFSTSNLKVGTHIITLTVKDSNGEESSISTIVKVKASRDPQKSSKVQQGRKRDLNTPPKAIIVCQKSAKVNEEITFDASHSYDPDGAIISYKWDFGDGQGAVGKIVRHSYSREGTFKVKLTVTDNRGVKHSASTSITIKGDERKNPLPDDEDDTLDQHQDWGSAKFALIYGDHWYAQSFIPSHGDILTRVEICIKKLERKLPSDTTDNKDTHKDLHKGFSSMLKNIFRFRKRISLFSSRMSSLVSSLSSHLNQPYSPKPKPRGNKPGDLIVSIRSNLLGKDLARASIRYDDLERDEVVWVEFDIPDIDVSDYMYSDELDSVTKHLYIVVHTTGGDEKNCYAWLYDSSTIDRYEKGSKFSSYSAGKNWYEDEGEDFCFRTYGKDRPGDGIVERWGFFVGAPCPYTDRDAYGLRDVLHEKNPEEWPYDHIYVLVNEKSTMTNVRKGFHWIDRMEDGDDILFFMFAGHGGKGGEISLVQDPNDILNNELNDFEIDEELDKMGSRSILVVIESCHSGAAIYKPNGSKLYLPSDGRVIMVSSNASEFSWWMSKLKHSVFIYYLIEAFSGKGDLNKDKIVSAEEAFKYAAPRTASHVFWGRYQQHPDISDGYPTLADNRDELPIVTLR